jgi:hypothetical protein
MMPTQRRKSARKISDAGACCVFGIIQHSEKLDLRLSAVSNKSFKKDLFLNTRHFDGGLFPLPPPEGFPVVLGQFGFFPPPPDEPEFPFAILITSFISSKKIYR